MGDGLNIMRQGWLVKSSSGKAGLSHKFTKENWQKRWFVLHGGPSVAQPRLVYYKDEAGYRNGGEASGQLALRGAEAKMVTVMNPAMGFVDEEVTFEVQAAQRTLPLKVGAEDAQAWIDSINEAVAHTRNQRRRRRTQGAGAGKEAAVSSGSAVFNGSADRTVAPGPAAAGGPIDPMNADAAESLESYPEDHVFREGFLLKRSGGAVQGKKVSMGELRKNWDKRWFVLRKNRLHYFKTPDDPSKGKAERGSCSLADVQIADYNDPDKEPDRARFKLRAKEPDGSERMFTLEAARQDDMDGWIDRIEFVCELHKHRSPAEAVRQVTAAPSPVSATDDPMAFDDVGVDYIKSPSNSSSHGNVMNPLNPGGTVAKTMNPFNDDFEADSGTMKHASKVHNPLADDSDDEIFDNIEVVIGSVGAAAADQNASGQEAELSKQCAALKTQIEERSTKVYHEGYLLKKSGGQEAASDPAGKKRMRGLANVEKWDRRYFVLKFRRVFYYKDQQAFRGQKEPRGSMNMRGCTRGSADRGVKGVF
jgi:hypothetical protein